jgi:hypothetical protein
MSLSTVVEERVQERPFLVVRARLPDGRLVIVAQDGFDGA